MTHAESVLVVKQNAALRDSVAILVAEAELRKRRMTEMAEQRRAVLCVLRILKASGALAGSDLILARKKLEQVGIEL